MASKNVPGNASGGSSAISQHKRLAMGQDIGVSDVQDMSSLSAGNGFSGKTRGHMSDGARGAGKPIKHTRGRHPAQAAPDHGGY